MSLLDLQGMQSPPAGSATPSVLSLLVCGQDPNSVVSTVLCETPEEPS